MNIQLVSNESNRKIVSDRITLSLLSSPKSLDEFDVTVFDFTSASLWCYQQGTTNSINEINDFRSIRLMVEHKKKSAVVFVLPPNHWFYYGSSYDSSFKGYRYKKRIKDCLVELRTIVSEALPQLVYSISLVFENTTTTIGDVQYSASFFLDTFYPTKTKSGKSQKTTTISLDNNNYLTTLQIFDSNESFMNFVKSIVPPEEKEQLPDWAKEIQILNDADLNAEIERLQNRIIDLKKRIEETEVQLKENSRIKSILYTNGNELVDVVFSILEQVLECDLSDYIDEKKEDFLIKKENYTLIGEIKGVTSNIKNENIGQIEMHYQSYMDRLAEEERNEHVHQILIMNPFRNKPLSQREPVHDTQIKLAKRNDCLIIETSTLLKLYEDYMKGYLTVADCEKLFTQKTGLLTVEDFDLPND